MMNAELFFKEKIIKQGGCQFVDFMNLALYHPEFGYYANKSSIFGRNADFITAPELSHHFAYSIAQQVKEIMQLTSATNILELGAGRGRLCMDLLLHLQHMQSLPEKYYILDLSANLKQTQMQYIEQEHPEFMGRIEWLSEWPKNFSGAVIANEVLDAMPVHRFLWKGGQVFDSVITVDENSQELQEHFLPTDNQQLLEFVQGLSLATESMYCSEVNLWLPGWLSGLYHSLDCAVVLLIDYGYPRSEYYHPDRAAGTIMCHLQQRAHANFLLYPGQQDISAHVDFTHVADAALACGFDVLGFTNQASFLLATGILDAISIDDWTANIHLKILLQAQEMGEIFKVMALGKNVTSFLSGFKMFDKRSSL